jgi:LysM repeat protein
VLFGTLLVPLKVEAGLLSSLFGVGDQAYADTNTNTVSPLQFSGDNLQTITLLQVNNTTDTNPNTNIVDNALVSSVGPMGVSDGTNTTDSSLDQTSVYVVRTGDSISQIAPMFGVSVNTILWANDMKLGDKLTPGEVLVVLPISGIEHTVTSGQTLNSIATLYKADPLEIARYNGITEDTKLAVGDKLIVPDAVRAEENDIPIQNLSASIAKDEQYYQNYPIKNLSGYYIDPVPGYRKSQGLHGNNAVDLAIATGTPIHAAASGRVILARTGYNGGFGNMVIISHPNGTETLYAHQSKIATETGAQISQGEVIGYVGSTGHSTGPHLHFEVHGVRNPGADGSWKY